jgi:hypothetical protein
MKFIKLRNCGLVARVSDQDFEYLDQYRWNLGNRQYAVRTHRKADGPGSQAVVMHRQIMRAEKGQIIDHIDGDSLNNQRSNLRFASIALNTHNCASRRGSTSKYKGVCWAKDTGRWQAQCKFRYQSIYIGQFDNEVEAARAYDAKMRELWGDDAFQNFPIAGAA